MNECYYKNCLLLARVDTVGDRFPYVVMPYTTTGMGWPLTEFRLTPCFKLFRCRFRISHYFCSERELAESSRHCSCGHLIFLSRVVLNSSVSAPLVLRERIQGCVFIVLFDSLT